MKCGCYYMLNVEISKFVHGNSPARSENDHTYTDDMGFVKLRMAVVIYL